MKALVGIDEMGTFLQNLIHNFFREICGKVLYIVQKTPDVFFMSVKKCMWEGEVEASWLFGQHR